MSKQSWRRTAPKVLFKIDEQIAAAEKRSGQRITTTWLAEEIGLSRMQLYSYRKNAVGFNPDWGVMVRLADVLGCSLVDLIENPDAVPLAILQAAESR